MIIPCKSIDHLLQDSLKQKVTGRNDIYIEKTILPDQAILDTYATRFFSFRCQ
jgi:hypothetical protein